MTQPVRLHRKEENSSVSQLCMDTLEAWVQSHALLCLIVLSCLLMAAFVVLIFTLTGVSATESGVVYNQFDKII